MESRTLRRRLRSPTREECRLAQDGSTTQSSPGEGATTTSTSTAPPTASGVMLLAMRRSGPPTSLADTLRLLHRNHAYEHRSLAQNCQALTQHLMRSAQQQQEQLLQRAARPRSAAPYTPHRTPTVEYVGGTRDKTPCDESRRATFAAPQIAKEASGRDSGDRRRPRRRHASGRRLTRDTISDIEATQFRSGVTNKLIDLMDEVCEMHACRQNMHDQIYDAMRLDPRWSRSGAGQTRLAGRPTHEQLHALGNAMKALEGLQSACVELVASYLTPEEKRYLGIDSHRFQTHKERATTYQYIDPTTSSQPHRPRYSSRRSGSGGTTSSIRRSSGDRTPDGQAAQVADHHHHHPHSDQHRHREQHTRRGSGHRSSHSPTATSSPTHASRKERDVTLARSDGRQNTTAPQASAPSHQKTRRSRDTPHAARRAKQASGHQVALPSSSLRPTPLTPEQQRTTGLAVSTAPSNAATLAAAVPASEDTGPEGTPERAYRPVVSASTIGNGELSTNEAPRPVAPPQSPTTNATIPAATSTALLPPQSIVTSDPKGAFTGGAAAVAVGMSTPPLSARRAMIQRLLVDSDSDSEA